MACTSGIAPAYGTFLEMSLENITPRKGILAQMALIRTFTGI
jgi:hypothetical protein